MNRASFLLSVFLASGVAAPAQVDWPDLKFTQVASGASLCTSIVDPKDGTGRLFVTHQPGQVMLVQSNTTVPFLDLQDRVHYYVNGELGLLSVAFPPGFATNQHFYVFYNSEPDGDATVSRFFVSGTNANFADPGSEQKVLVVPAPVFAQSGGLLLFGPDGLLYIGMGDTGFSASEANEAQSPQSLQGKILRIDVESSTNSYRIPVDNPFAANPAARPEIWALGVRNPWRFSFDRLTGDFYLGDVGQVESEEVDFKAAGTPGGRNFGWPIREGMHLYAGPENSGLTLDDPIAEYFHTGPPSSITGGYVYRGPGPSRLTGIYLYADSYSGRIWGLKRDGGKWVSQLLAKVPYFITTFGESESGQLYLANYVSGKLYLIEDSGRAVAPVFAPPGTNSFSESISLVSLSTNALIRYTTNGIDPAITDPAITNGGSVIISSGTTLKAVSFRGDLQPSPVTAQTFVLKVARPAFTPPQGPLTNGQAISLSCLTPGAAIRFTLDGTDPTAASPLYSASIAWDGSSILKARAFKAGFTDSAVAVLPPAGLQIQGFSILPDLISDTFSCSSITGRSYQMQVSDDLIHWRNFGQTQAGTGATLVFRNINIYPALARRLYRLQAIDDLGL